MGAVPTTVNGAADTVDGIIHAAIFEVAVTAVITYCSAQLPFLKFPIFSQLFSFLVNKIAGLIYIFLSQYATFVVIDLQVGAEKFAYVAAEGALRKAMLAGDAGAVAAAAAQYKQALGSLIHYDGSATK